MKRVSIETFGLALLAAAAAVVTTGTSAGAFPWSTDMYRGPQVSTFAEAPRVMPDGVLAVNGVHYNLHYGQPRNLPLAPAVPPMKLELMTIKLHNPVSPSSVNLARGKERFETNCAPCHGALGQGNGSVVHLLEHKPANLLTGVSRNLPDGYIYGYIRNGGVWMPAYADAMSSTERWQVVRYVRALQQQLGEQTAAVPPAEPGPHRDVTDSDQSYSEQGSDSP